MIYPSTLERNSRFFIKFFYRLQVNDADQLRVEVTNEADKTQAEVIDDADETQAEVIEDPDEPQAEVTYDSDEFQAMVNEVDDATFIICVHGSDGGASDDDAKDLDPVEASALLERHDLVAAVTPQKPPTPRKMRKCHQTKIPNDGDQRLVQNVCQKLTSSKPPAKIAKRVRTPIRSKSSKSNRIHAKKPANDFKCNQCGKSYAFKYRLERHQLTHTGERFKCNFCDKTYSRPDHRKRHEREKH